MSGCGIIWALCKSAPRSRQITMPAPNRSVFYKPDALTNSVNALRSYSEWNIYANKLLCYSRLIAGVCITPAFLAKAFESTDCASQRMPRNDPHNCLFPRVSRPHLICGSLCPQSPHFASQIGSAILQGLLSWPADTDRPHYNGNNRPCLIPWKLCGIKIKDNDTSETAGDNKKIKWDELCWLHEIC